MPVEIISYIATFIISAGLAVIGIIISYQLYQVHQKPVFQVLLYQQIFLISFYIYGIWGNLALREVIADLSLSEELTTKLTIFIPILGIPFLVISWFMLIRFSFILNGFKVSNRTAYFYFPIFITVIFVFSLLVQKGIIEINGKPDLFIIRTLVVLNLAIHLFFISPFLVKKKYTPIIKETGFNNQLALVYVAGMVIYSTILCFYNVFGFISICISIILLFAGSILIPVAIRWNSKVQVQDIQNGNIDFDEFCKVYEISRREAEIVLEICSGKTNKAISEKLYITIQTVKDHNHRIFTKTGVKSRVQLSNLVREKTGL